MLETDKYILSRIDYTLLAQTATPAQIQTLCEEAARFSFASVCVPPCYVKQARSTLDNFHSKVAVCTVAGFPLGYSVSTMKARETRAALDEGATEIDMVINVGMLISGEHTYVFDEIAKLKSIAGGNILKVIIETCLLDESAKLTACRLVTQAGADYIKTSTGFSTGGATVADVVLLRENVGPNVKVKAAGGIRTAEFARELAAAGADRLGMSAAVKAFGLG